MAAPSRQDRTRCHHDARDVGEINHAAYQTVQAKLGAPPTDAANGPLGEIFTVAEAAAYLRLSEADVLRLVHEQGLPARQLATEWRFLKAAIQDWLRAGRTPRPDFWEASAGAFADDPQLEAIVREAYRRRGHALPEERRCTSSSW